MTRPSRRTYPTTSSFARGVNLEERVVANRSDQVLDDRDPFSLSGTISETDEPEGGSAGGAGGGPPASSPGM